ncbi:glycosyltransferase family 4 protein [Phreatobacter oligotrophus]|jgi:glycosyltransferase involved in cell wall biosynthesis|uniref:glycosyltransferase family 4 protein n=1 Tax=Phreatobacter oligotrophus TaxID=1122261 RepID=UPI0023524F3B|nr:glycosyltransferase family 1 protein [Phreatobacter oligotrophus]MBX9992641.1 glycosyltransferase family 1 protein [Phreatobacter oligotrophus]
MRVALATDAWAPQINGVVRSLTETAAALGPLGHSVEFITPEGLPSWPLPTYPDIRLAIGAGAAVAERLDRLAPDALHIATEGPIGHAARRWAMARRLPFTTSYHTRYPEYVRARAPVPEALTYAWLRHFHGPASRTLVPTETMRRELASWGFRNLSVWSRGVDSRLFRPRDLEPVAWPRPLMLSVGRVAVEKNLEAFLSLDLPGTKVVVGDGPQRAALEQRHPEAVFLGSRTGEALAEIYASADVFVFPSLTDTYGNVMQEALASGVPVAAFPVAGPLDVITDPAVGALDADLAVAIRRALTLDRAACRAFALTRSWEAAARQFASALAPFASVARAA